MSPTIACHKLGEIIRDKRKKAEAKRGRDVLIDMCMAYLARRPACDVLAGVFALGGGSSVASCSGVRGFIAAKASNVHGLPLATSRSCLISKSALLRSVERQTIMNSVVVWRSVVSSLLVKSGLLFMKKNTRHIHTQIAT